MGNWKMRYVDEAKFDRAAANAQARENEIRRPARKEDWWWQPGEWGRWIDLEKKTIGEISDARDKQASAVRDQLYADLKDQDIKIAATGAVPSAEAYRGVANNLNNDMLAYMYAEKSMEWEDEGAPLFAAQKLVAKDLVKQADTCDNADQKKALTQTSEFLRTTELKALLYSERPSSGRSSRYRGGIMMMLYEELRADQRFQEEWRYKELGRAAWEDEDEEGGEDSHRPAQNGNGVATNGNGTNKGPEISEEQLKTISGGVLWAIKHAAKKIREERERTVNEAYGATKGDIAVAREIIKTNGSMTTFARKLLTADYKKVAGYRAILEAFETAWKQKSSKRSIQTTIYKNYNYYGGYETLEDFHKFIGGQCSGDGPAVNAVFDNMDRVKLWLQIYDDHEWSNDSDNLAGQEAILASTLQQDDDTLRGLLNSALGAFVEKGKAYEKARRRLWRINSMGRFALTADLDAD